MTPEDIEHLQTIGRDAQNARREFILKDDQDAAWQHITTLNEARIDFVLDNGMPKPHIPPCFPSDDSDAFAGKPALRSAFGPSPTDSIDAIHLTRPAALHGSRVCRFSRVSYSIRLQSRLSVSSLSPFKDERKTKTTCTNPLSEARNLSRGSCPM